MRRLAATFISLLALIAAADESLSFKGDACMREYGQPDDRQYLAGNRGATRDVHVALHQRGTNASRSQPVKVSGVLSNVQLAALLQTFIDYESQDYWSLNTNRLFYRVYMEGDEHRALVALDYRCGGLCGHGSSSVYTYDQGKWHELYGLCDWYY
jgi:hypothetical protein